MPESHMAKAIQLAEQRGARRACEAFARDLYVGPFDDRGLAAPGHEHGDGFAIFIGEFRIGWFQRREEACDAADRFARARNEYGPKGVEKGTR